MDRRFLTVLGVSLMFALVVSAIFYQISARAGSGSVKGQTVEMKDIVIATKAMNMGVTVKPDDVKLAKVPVETFPRGAFSKVEDVIDRPTMSNILADEPVLEGRLASRDSGMGLAPIIPVGMRGVAVRVNDVAGVAGFVLPGMRVDVLVTGRPPNSEGTMTKTCLQNIRVLSAGQTMQADSKGQALPAPTVTLLVTPDQAEILTLANQEGNIQLVLRNGSDQLADRSMTPGVGIAELYGVKAQRVRTQVENPVESAPAPMRPRFQTATVVAQPPPPLPPPPDQIIVIRGNQRFVEAVSR
jgi:pilus assembly protein CpaB